MSEHFLALIPADPQTALPEQAEDLRARLGDMLGSDETRVKDYGKLQFIDCGEDFKSIACPACGAPLPKAQWQGWMEADWHGEDGFHLHRHTLPCCGTDQSLNALIYDAPQGFARWFVSARLNEPRDLTEAELAALSDHAGTPLRAIAQRY